MIKQYNSLLLFCKDDIFNTNDIIFISRLFKKVGVLSDEDGFYPLWTKAGKRNWLKSKFCQLTDSNIEKWGSRYNDKDYNLFCIDIVSPILKHDFLYSPDVLIKINKEDSFFGKEPYSFSCAIFIHLNIDLFSNVDINEISKSLTSKFSTVKSFAGTVPWCFFDERFGTESRQIIHASSATFLEDKYSFKIHSVYKDLLTELIW